MKKTYLTLAMSALLLLTGAGPAQAQKKGGDVVIAMGAGSIGAVPQKLVELLGSAEAQA